MTDDSIWSAAANGGLPIGKVIADRFLQFIGRDPVRRMTAVGEAWMVRPAGLPFRFEWHPKKEIVYLTRLGVMPEIGEAVALNVETEPGALNAIDIWLGGYAEARGMTHWRPRPGTGLVIGPDLSERFLEFLGRPADPTGRDRRVWHMRRPQLGLEFVWHPQRRTLYLVRLEVDPKKGFQIAKNLETHGDAINAMNIWLRGHQEGRTPGIKPQMQV